jgi:predicted GNAT family acetyltransferase
VTTAPDDGPGVADDSRHSRFLLVQDGAEAELTYRRVGKRLVLVHTGVPEALEGRGIGGRLVAAAAEEARRDGLTLVPHCPFARRWLENHPDAASGTTIDWPPEDPMEEE